jgi:hypothetical protein
VLYRRHGGNLTNDKTLDGHYFLMALKKSLDRRRRDGRAARSLPELGGAGE